ncbi:MAG: hypothetical protein M3430_04165 [Acidobacteriota bacterium]|nr:hypothetical protein [Acidobacteriota bacterium]
MFLQNANGGDQFSSATENNPAVNTTGLSDEDRARYEQVQAEINAMILLEEEKEAAARESVPDESTDDDLWLPL